MKGEERIGKRRVAKIHHTKIQIPYEKYDHCVHVNYTNKFIVKKDLKLE